MRRAKILALGMAGLTAAFLIATVPNYALMALTLTPLTLLVAGQLYLPRSRRFLQIWFNPIVLIDDGGEMVGLQPGHPVGRLSGKTLKYGYFRQRHEFIIVTHRFWLLAILGLTSIGATFFVLSEPGSPLDDPGLTYLYLFAASPWLTVMFLAGRWFTERRILRREGVALGSFSVHAVKPWNFQIRYHFVDHEERHQGGTVQSMVYNRDDDMTIIFYDESEAERSFPASAMLFHKLVWRDLQRSAAP